jgi:hypothetical protein
LPYKKYGVSKQQLAALPEGPKQRIITQVHYLATPHVLSAQHEGIGELRLRLLTCEASRVAVLLNNAYVPAKNL